MSRISGVFFILTLVVSVLSSQIQAAAAGPDCKGHWYWGYTTNLSEHFWTVGPHTYQIRGLIDGVTTFTPEPVSFTTTPGAPLYEGFVQLRFYAPLALLSGVIVSISQINPDQPTMFQVRDDLVGTKEQAKAFARTETMQVTWDGGPWAEIPRGPVKSFCKLDVIGSFRAGHGDDEDED